jgi:hypothetical protein
MLIEKLDRTQWRLSKAIEHVTTQIQHAIARGELPAEPDPALPPWRQTENPRGAAVSQAAREIQVALRDGELHAQGRLSTTQSRPWTHGLDGWDLHSGHHSTITPEQWRAGRTDVQLAVLTMIDGQFIDIRVPRFMVLAIWPVIEVPRGRSRRRCSPCCVARRARPSRRSARRPAGSSTRSAGSSLASRSARGSASSPLSASARSGRTRRARMGPTRSTASPSDAGQPQGADHPDRRGSS